MESCIAIILSILAWACLASVSRPADYQSELGLHPADPDASCPGRRKAPCLEGRGLADPASPRVAPSREGLGQTALAGTRKGRRAAPEERTG